MNSRARVIALILLVGVVVLYVVPIVREREQHRWEATSMALTRFQSELTSYGTFHRDLPATFSDAVKVLQESGVTFGKGREERSLGVRAHLDDSYCIGRVGWRALTLWEVIVGWAVRLVRPGRHAGLDRRRVRGRGTAADAAAASGFPPLV